MTISDDTLNALKWFSKSFAHLQRKMHSLCASRLQFNCLNLFIRRICHISTNVLAVLCATTILRLYKITVYCIVLV